MVSEPSTCDLGMEDEEARVQCYIRLQGIVRELSDQLRHMNARSAAELKRMVAARALSPTTSTGFTLPRITGCDMAYLAPSSGIATLENDSGIGLSILQRPDAFECSLPGRNLHRPVEQENLEGDSDEDAETEVGLSKTVTSGNSEVVAVIEAGDAVGGEESDNKAVITGNDNDIAMNSFPFSESSYVPSLSSLTPCSSMATLRIWVICRSPYTIEITAEGSADVSVEARVALGTRRIISEGRAYSLRGSTKFKREGIGVHAVAAWLGVEKISRRTFSNSEAATLIYRANGTKWWHKLHKLKQMVGVQQGAASMDMSGLGKEHVKSMTGEQIAAPSSPKDGEDVSIPLGHRKMEELKLGTMMGVFVPCLQNILEIIYYIRFSWIVGMGGIAGSLLLVSCCGLCTFLTSVSLSAIATNGVMKGGGPCYLIGHTRGPEVGASIGLCFFLGNAVAGALYVFGDLATREKFRTDRLLTATVAWPSPAIVYIGIILSTLGAALQSLKGN